MSRYTLDERLDHVDDFADLSPEEEGRAAERAHHSGGDPSVRASLTSSSTRRGTPTPRATGERRQAQRDERQARGALYPRSGSVAVAPVNPPVPR